MIAAIYARKSTEQHVAGEQKSVARQIHHARAFAGRHGWSVDDRYVFVDDGISGAEFARRPGFVRLMNTLKPRSPFQALIMSEESRLGRESIETAYALKQIVSAGVRVFFYLEDRERRLDSPVDKIMLSLTTFADETERARASQRSTDKALQLARAGHVTGGRVFGYDNVRVDSHTERRINESEAAVVRRIFRMAADGIGQKRIALQLNADGVPAPRAQQCRPTGWAQSSVHQVLFRTLYRGENVWNRTRKRNDWGAKQPARRPEDQWLRMPAEQLRIVSDNLWNAAHARIADARRLYHDTTKGLRGGRPRIDSKYLLPGLATCTCCTGGLLVRTHSSGSGHSRRRAFFYGCTTHFNRGPSVCPNKVQVPMDLVNHAVIASLADIMTPDLVQDIVARVREIAEPAKPDAERQRLERALADSTRQIARLTEAITLGAVGVPELVTELQKTHTRRQELARRVELGRPHVLPAPIDWAAVEREGQSVLRNWREQLAGQPAEARAVLRELLEGRRIRFTPVDEPHERGYRFAGDAGVGGLLEGAVLARVASVQDPVGTIL